MLRSYDVLHFAGHCVYRWGGDPTLSGWIFNAKNKEILSANELTRVDRIPKFVFSNACESGITPDRSQERSVDLAPSFAEAFFARGVANFVCTAWPVDDFAARVFALILYSSLLGIGLDRTSLGLDNKDANTERRPDPMFMYEAMKEARTTIARLPTGRLTWGAYQHYGNPYFQFFQKPLTNPAEAQKPAAAESGAANTETAPHVVESEASAAAAESSAAEGRSSAVSAQDTADDSAQQRATGKRSSKTS
jgi:hypothetical protein